MASRVSVFDREAADRAQIIEAVRNEWLPLAGQGGNRGAGAKRDELRARFGLTDRDFYAVAGIVRPDQSAPGRDRRTRVTGDKLTKEDFQRLDGEIREWLAYPANDVYQRQQLRASICAQFGLTSRGFSHRASMLRDKARLTAEEPKPAAPVHIGPKMIPGVTLAMLVAGRASRVRLPA